LPPDVCFLPPDADQVVISVNPKAGARSSRPRVQRLVELLESGGFKPRVLTDLDEVACVANKSHSEGRLRALIGVGGDGTAAELVNRTQAGLPITLMPAGNENLLARHLGLGTEPQTIFRTVAEGALLQLDAARANDRVFLLMIGCGFDAEVVRRVHQRRTGHIRSRDYFKPILETIRSYEYPQLRVYWGDPTGDAAEAGPPIDVRWLFAFNLPCYAGGLELVPGANGRDGLLDVCTFARGSLRHGLRYVASAFLRRHQRLADCTIRRADRLRITSDARVPYQLDGDPGGFLPVDVEVLPGRLTMVVPAERA